MNLVGKFCLLLDNYFGTGRGLRSILFILLAIAIPLTLPGTIQNVRGMVVDTHLVMTGPLSIDDDRVASALTLTSAPGEKMILFDAHTGTSITFNLPANINDTYAITLSGDKIVTVGFKNIFFGPYVIYYCILPHASPLQPCGPWVQIQSVLEPIAPTFSGDVIAWATSARTGIITGFSYYRFSSGTVTSVPVPGIQNNVVTNGQLIAFGAKATPASPSTTVMYYDTSAPTPVVVDTALPNAGSPNPNSQMSISQDIIAFNDNTTTPVCVTGTAAQICESPIRYYDIYRNQASPPGAGPLGSVGGQELYGNRIVFPASESSLKNDCNGNGSFFTNSSTLGGTTPDMCLDVWNIRDPAYVSPLLDPSATPILPPYLVFSINTFEAVSGNLVAFLSSSGPLVTPTLHVVTLPLKGDVNQDGLVNVIDLVLVALCIGQSLRSSSC